MDNIYISLENVTVFAELSNQFNKRTGDIDAEVTCVFYNKNTTVEIGRATIVVRDNKYPVFGEYHAKKILAEKDNRNAILRQFQLID